MFHIGVSGKFTMVVTKADVWVIQEDKTLPYKQRKCERCNPLTVPGQHVQIETGCHRVDMIINHKTVHVPTVTPQCFGIPGRLFHEESNICECINTITGLTGNIITMWDAAIPTSKKRNLCQK
jgi:hypothetical protein